jgi:coenzyme Q-binding protein COQ10
MPRHSETRYLPYTPDQLFDLVADVAKYDEFLPWVVAVRLRSSSETETVADLVVGFNAFKERFTSRVVKERPTRICVDYVEGPLKFLHNEWRFDPSPSGGTTVHFSVDFAFRSRLFESLAGAMFDRALRRMTNAFEQRAAALYGISKSSAQSAA